MSHVQQTIRRKEIYHFNIRLNNSFYRKTLKTDSPKQARKYVSSINQFISEEKDLKKSDIDSFIEQLIANTVNRVIRTSKLITEPLSNEAKRAHSGWYNRNLNAITSNCQVDFDMSDYKPEYKVYPSFNEHVVSLLKNDTNNSEFFSSFRKQIFHTKVNLKSGTLSISTDGYYSYKHSGNRVKNPISIKYQIENEQIDMKIATKKSYFVKGEHENFVNERKSATGWLKRDASNLTYVNGEKLTFEYEGDYEIDSDHEFYDYFQYPSKEGYYYVHLTSVIDSHVKRMELALKNGDLIEFRRTTEEIYKQFSDYLPNPEIKPKLSKHDNTISKSKIPTFNEVLGDYFKFVSKKHEKSKPKNKNSLLGHRKRGAQLFSFELGNLSLDQITASQLISLWSSIVNYPRTNNKYKELPYLGLNDKELWEAAYENDEELPQELERASDTLKKTKTFIFDFFAWASDIESLLPHNPLVDSKIMRDNFPLPTERKKKRGAFDDVQVRSIISLCKKDINKQEHLAILLMVFHGFRNSEVTNLTCADFLEEHKVQYIYIRKGKTINANRKVLTWSLFTTETRSK